MAVLPIRITGEPVLHAAAAEVETIDDGVRSLVADMFETMDAAPGVGLAAPQVGVASRIFVYGWTDEHDVVHRGVAINPDLLITPVPLGDADEETESEGCLSFPGERFPLRRAERALLRATNLDGDAFEIETSGWLARIFQHEFDHLNGVLYTDRLAQPFVKPVAKITRKNSWGVPGVSWTPGVDQPEG